MKRILVIIALCSPLLMQAQSIEHILKSIEQNNKELKAQKHAADAYQCDPGLRNGYPVGDQRQVTGLVGCLFRREFQRQFDGHNF